MWMGKWGGGIYVSVLVKKCGIFVCVIVVVEIVMCDIVAEP